MTDMNIKADNIQSFRPYHPGELIKEELECRGIRQKDFAKKFGFSYSDINADLLVRMQTDYNLQMARRNSTLLERLNKIKKIAAIF